MKKVLIVGAGGIGRSLSVILNDFVKRGLPYFVDTQFVFCDADEVEVENVWTQGFSPTDAQSCLPKTIAIFKACRSANIVGKVERVEKESQLDGYEAIFIAVDNLETRRFIYEYCFSHDIYFVDMRVNGTNYMVLDSKMNREELRESVVSTGEAGPTSCLFKWEKEQGIVHAVPFIAASTGLQFYLNNLRKQENLLIDAALGS